MDPALVSRLQVGDAYPHDTICRACSRGRRRRRAVLPAAAIGEMTSTQLGPKLCETTGGGRFVKIPGFPGERIDRRLLTDIEFLLEKYKNKFFITDGYSTDPIHARNGERDQAWRSTSSRTSPGPRSGARSPGLPSGPSRSGTSRAPRSAGSAIGTSTTAAATTCTCRGPTPRPAGETGEDRVRSSAPRQVDELSRRPKSLCRAAAPTRSSGRSSAAPFRRSAGKALVHRIDGHPGEAAQARRPDVAAPPYRSPSLNGSPGSGSATIHDSASSSPSSWSSPHPACPANRRIRVSPSGGCSRSTSPTSPTTSFGDARIQELPQRHDAIGLDRPPMYCRSSEPATSACQAPAPPRRPLSRTAG